MLTRRAAANLLVTRARPMMGPAFVFQKGPAAGESPPPATHAILVRMDRAHTRENAGLEAEIMGGYGRVSK